MADQQRLTDESEMPFGRFQHMNMCNVPARYLTYLYDQPWMKNSKKPEHVQVRKYIEENLDVIQQQALQGNG